MAVDNSKWEEVDHEDSPAGQIVGPSGSYGVEGEGDPLGLGAFVECVYASINITEKLRASRSLAVFKILTWNPVRSHFA
jgi:hypothetical protein